MIDEKTKTILPIQKLLKAIKPEELQQKEAQFRQNNTINSSSRIFQFIKILQLVKRFSNR